jgi:hypothetical protein
MRTDCATLVTLRHALCPQNRTVTALVPGQQIQALAPDWRRPYIALLNGKPVMRRDWHVVVERGQVLMFVDVEAIPQGGGGGSNPVRMIAMLAVVALSAGMAAWIGGAAMFAGSGTLLGLGGSAWGAIGAGAVMMVGSALVNALLPAQNQNLALGSGTQTASPTYNLQAQGNMARLEQAIPEHFGRMAFYPDLAAQPYMEYHGQEQYLYMLLCVGRGWYDIESIGIEDTPFSEFDEVEYEVINPGESLGMFPGAVVTATEVAGNEMPYNTNVGDFTASAPETVSQHIGFDLVCARGLYHANDNGSLSSMTVTADLMLCQIDDFGTEIGSWYTARSVTYTASTPTPQRYSEKVAVTPGRYKARVKRTNVEETDTRYGHAIAWAGLRAYLRDNTTWDDMTHVAVKMRATNQLSSMSARKVRLIATRELEQWTGYAWSDRAATRSIAWAAAHLAREIWPESRIDLDALLTLNGILATRGDEFNGRFDSLRGAWEALCAILEAGRVKPYVQGGILRVVRDQAESLPVAVFSMRNIRKGSFKINYVMPSEETADKVTVKYFDGVAWADRRVTVGVAGATTTKPPTVELFGVVDRNQAGREGLYKVGCNLWRRKLISFTADAEGQSLSMGDLIAVQHVMPGWGQSAEVVAWDAATLTATLDEDLTWADGETHYVAFRTRIGEFHGPFQVVAGATANEVELVDDPTNGGAWAPYTGTDGERTHVIFGWGATVYQPARVLSVVPRSMTDIEIECVNEDPRVHTIEDGVAIPPAETSQLAGYQLAPALSGLISRSMPLNPTAMLLSWNHAPWADHYIIEQSNDYESWIRTGETSTNSYTAQAIYGNATIIRVAAVGAARGPWVMIHYGSTASYAWHADGSTLAWNVDGSTLAWRY